MTEVEWDRYPIVAADEKARAWLQIHGDLGRAHNTVDAYGRGLEDYFRFSHRAGVRPEQCYELCNLTHPEWVRGIHRAYVDAGARCLLTNTFQANPAALGRHGPARRDAERARRLDPKLPPLPSEPRAAEAPSVRAW